MHTVGTHPHEPCWLRRRGRAPREACRHLTEAWLSLANRARLRQDSFGTRWESEGESQGCLPSQRREKPGDDEVGWQEEEEFCFKPSVAGTPLGSWISGSGFGLGGLA